MRLLVFAFAALTLLPLPGAIAGLDLPALQAVEKQVQSVAEKAMPCTVALLHSQKEGLASGSGSIISKDGIILTAAHVVGDATSVDVTFTDGRHVHAKVLGADYARDVALAKIVEPGDYPSIELGETRGMAVGTMVVALGHPGGFDLQRKPPVRFGRVMDFDREGYIRTDCTLVGGDSGGPLLNLQGKVIGVHSTVGVDMSMNNDSPVDAVRTDWDRLMKGDHWGQADRPGASKLAPSELHGLNLEKFRARVLQAAMKSKGQMQASPEIIARWLSECGMKRDYVNTMEPLDLADFMQRALGGDGLAHPHLNVSGNSGAAFTSEELSGLNLDKFRQRVVREAMKNKGILDASPDLITGWLRDCGMKEERVTKMSPEEVAGFVQRTLGGEGRVYRKEGEGVPEGLDVAKFRRRVLEESAKASGQLETPSETIAQWLTDCGANKSKIAAMTPDDLATAMKNAMASAGQAESGPQSSEDADAVIEEQDRAFLDTVKPVLNRVTPSIVALLDGDKVLAMGTVVRKNGFILTKHSEIARCKNGLKVRLSDGRTFPAVEMQRFADHDLALVKIAADGLNPVTFSGEMAVSPGSFLFTPGCNPEEPMAGLGVLSVAERSLRDTGGFLGVGVNEVNDAIEVTHVVIDSPASKAGLRRKDQILAIDNMPFHTVQDFTDKVRKFPPDSKVSVRYRRGDEEKSVDVVMADRSKLPSRGQTHDPASAFGTDVSELRSGYPAILQHDQPLKPEDCGGVLLDLKGDIVGVNIARAGRVDTYAIPAKVVADLLSAVDFQQLEEKAAETGAKPPKA